MLRVVLDTNVVISAMLNQAGWEATVVALGLEGRYELCVSPQILREYKQVISRSKFSRVPHRLARFLAPFEKLALRVTPGRSLSVCPDPDDNRFLECAEASHADYLVTGNKRHFPDSWGRTKIVNAREFLEQFRRDA